MKLDLLLSIEVFSSCVLVGGFGGASGSLGRQRIVLLQSELAPAGKLRSLEDCLTDKVSLAGQILTSDTVAHKSETEGLWTNKYLTSSYIRTLLYALGLRAPYWSL